jgi:hypothetical protein
MIRSSKIGDKYVFSSSAFAFVDCRDIYQLPDGNRSNIDYPYVASIQLKTKRSEQSFIVTISDSSDFSFDCIMFLEDIERLRYRHDGKIIND